MAIYAYWWCYWYFERFPYSRCENILLHAFKVVSFGLANMPSSFQKDIKAINVGLCYVIDFL